MTREAGGLLRMRLPLQAFRVRVSADGHLDQELGPWARENVPDETTVRLARAGRVRGVVLED
ncbi:MAG: hypothetical protein GY711_29290 [bacterium]|nr:hypothetical protein [bacterium]